MGCGGVAPGSTEHPYKPNVGCSHSPSASTITKHEEVYESGRGDHVSTEKASLAG